MIKANKDIERKQSIIKEEEEETTLLLPLRIIPSYSFRDAVVYAWLIWMSDTQQRCIVYFDNNSLNPIELQGKMCSSLSTSILLIKPRISNGWKAFMYKSHNEFKLLSTISKFKNTLILNSILENDSNFWKEKFDKVSNSYLQTKPKDLSIRIKNWDVVLPCDHTFSNLVCLQSFFINSILLLPWKNIMLSHKNINATGTTPKIRVILPASNQREKDKILYKQLRTNHLKKPTEVVKVKSIVLPKVIQTPTTPFLFASSFFASIKELVSFYPKQVYGSFPTISSIPKSMHYYRDQLHSNEMDTPTEIAIKYLSWCWEEFKLTGWIILQFSNTTRKETLTSSLFQEWIYDVCLLNDLYVFLRPTHWRYDNVEIQHTSGAFQSLSIPLHEYVLLKGKIS